MFLWKVQMLRENSEKRLRKKWLPYVKSNWKWHKKVSDILFSPVHIKTAQVDLLATPIYFPGNGFPWQLRGGCKINNAHFLSFEDRGGGRGRRFENCLIIKKAQKMSIIFFRFKIWFFGYKKWCSFFDKRNNFWC